MFSLQRVCYFSSAKLVTQLDACHPGGPSVLCSGQRGVGAQAREELLVTSENWPPPPAQS